MQQIKIPFLKKFLVIIFLVSFQFVHSQDPLLYDYDWYIQKINIDDIDLYPPSGGFQGILYFSESYFNMGHPSCEEGLSGGITYSGTDSFDLDDSPVILLDMGCPQAHLNYMNLHESFYYVDLWLAKNPFNYMIEVNGTDLYLTIENGDGDIAYYSINPLKTSAFVLTQINIYPNPADELLFVETKIPLTKLVVYDLSGKLILENNGMDQLHSTINVSGLSKGLYFVKLQFNNKNVVIKFIRG